MDKDLQSARQEAYRYIRKMALTANIIGRTPIEDDVIDTADILGGQVGLSEDLRALKKGKQNPSTLVIDRYKILMGPMIPPGEIEQFLLRPFEKRT